MPTIREIAGDEMALVAAVSDYLDVPPGQAEYRLLGTGELAQVALCHDPQPVALKVPREVMFGGAAVRFEGMMLDRLQDYAEASGDQPPLAIPKIFEIKDSAQPHWLAMAVLAGRPMQLHEAVSLSTAGQVALGAAVGRFAAWLASAYSLDEYRADVPLYNVHDHFRPNRQRTMQQLAGLLDESWLSCNGFPALEDAFADVYSQFYHLQRQRRLLPSIVGHDDLGCHNVMFETDEKTACRRPSGVIDFEATKPSQPEEELRYVWALGPATGQAARQAYESASGQELDTELLDYWGRCQLVTTTVGLLLITGWDGAAAHYQARRQMLEQLLPQHDWSELESRTAAMPPRGYDQLNRRLNLFEMVRQHAANQALGGACIMGHGPANSSGMVYGAGLEEWATAQASRAQGS